ncbi:peptidoglycan-binding domain-containing protein [Streptomyces sp. NPDC005474]|uniref:peptidoglycan-binding domain-containing protein n=1 Tax=Streptomyces sp. NPDC005474 TaxID=3154878 RepID=UPI0034567EF1
MLTTTFARRAALVAAATALAAAAISGTANASTSAPYIGDGYRNTTSGVRCVQAIINNWYESWGPGSPRIAEDGLWGPQTKQALVQYQEAFSVRPDGVVGPQTGYALLTSDAYDPNQGRNGRCYPYIPTPAGY